MFVLTVLWAKGWLENAIFVHAPIGPGGEQKKARSSPTGPSIRTIRARMRQMSRLATFSAFASMNSRRGSTASPINMENI